MRRAEALAGIVAGPFFLVSVGLNTCSARARAATASDPPGRRAGRHPPRPRRTPCQVLGQVQSSRGSLPFNTARPAVARRAASLRIWIGQIWDSATSSSATIEMRSDKATSGRGHDGLLQPDRTGTAAPRFGEQLGSHRHDRPPMSTNWTNLVRECEYARVTGHKPEIDGRSSRSSGFCWSRVLR